MSHENSHVLEASPNRDNERSTDDNDQQQLVLRIEETNQQPIVPASFMNNLENQLFVGSATARPVIVVGKIGGVASDGRCVRFTEGST